MGGDITFSISFLRVFLCIIMSIFVAQQTIPWWVVLFFAVSALDLRWKPRKDGG